MAYEGPLISRKEAKEQELKRYFTGEPCSKGHISERLTSSRQCVECLAEYRRGNPRSPEKIKEYNANVTAKRRAKELRLYVKLVARNSCLLDQTANTAQNNVDTKLNTSDFETGLKTSSKNRKASTNGYLDTSATKERQKRAKPFILLAFRASMVTLDSDMFQPESALAALKQENPKTIERNT